MAGPVGPRAARAAASDATAVRELRSLGDDETLLVQSGKPVGVPLTDATGATC